MTILYSNDRWIGGYHKPAGILPAKMHYHRNPGIRNGGIIEICFCKEQLTISQGPVLNFGAIDLELVILQAGNLDLHVIYFPVSTNNKIIAKIRMVIPSTNRLNTIRFTKRLL
jgi:hypothetical protein